jgi:hypothetical protein
MHMHMHMHTHTHMHTHMHMHMHMHTPHVFPWVEQARTAASGGMAPHGYGPTARTATGWPSPRLRYVAMVSP